LRGGARVDSDSRRMRAAAATSPTARSKAASFMLDGFVNPDSFRTNWMDASRISSSLAGGSKLNRVRMLRHIVFLRVGPHVRREAG
jgi:hypothetical protein